MSIKSLNLKLFHKFPFQVFDLSFGLGFLAHKMMMQIVWKILFWSLSVVFFSFSISPFNCSHIIKPCSILVFRTTLIKITGVFTRRIPKSHFFQNVGSKHVAPSTSS